MSRVVHRLVLGIIMGGLLGVEGWAAVVRALPTDHRGTGKSGFTLLSPARTGVLATNLLTGDARLTNAVAQNGSGVALGDVDGDGRPDLYVGHLEGRNHLYRNLGDGTFADVDPGEAACADQYTSGVVLADVDGDRDLDLLVSGIAVGTRLFLNDGRGVFRERRDSGLSRTATPMSLALADIDGDGDLDLYAAHYLDILHLADPTTRLSFRNENGRQVLDRVNNQPASQPPWKDRFLVKPGGGVLELAEPDALYLNDGQGRFTPVDAQPGVFVDAEGQPAPAYRDYGLGAMFRDVDGDGDPDLYVCNDTGSEDRFWINSGRGTFRAAPANALRHVSFSSMGIDFADLDRDGHDDFLVVDMLARDRSRRLTQLSRSAPFPIDAESARTRPMYSRNTLFLGRPDGTFAETALFAGVAATDWSWCPMFLDVDLDGYEDLIISNGFEQDVLDQDTSDSFRSRRWTVEQVKRYRGFYPSWPTPVAAYRNRGDATFEDAAAAWGFRVEGVGNGMAAGDLDGDGDLDLVINRLNEAPAIYRNDAAAPRIGVRLAGRAPNTQGVGAKVRLLGASVTQSQEILGGGRYLSSDEAMRVFAVPEHAPGSLRLEVRWRDGSLSVVTNVQPDHVYDVAQAEAQTGPDVMQPATPAAPGPYFSEVSRLLQGHRHRENAFDDWARQPLLPRRLSRLGPGIGWIDYNGDGWEDLVVGGAQGDQLAIFFNLPGQTAFRAEVPQRTNVVDQGAMVGWPNGQGGRDLLVAGSNYELESGEPSRISWYSRGAETRDIEAGPSAMGPLVAADVDRDGDLDLFVGQRVQSGRYPEPVSSEIWRNEKDRFHLEDDLRAPFRNLGMVTGAVWDDLDLDGDPDLVVTLEWGPVKVFRNDGGRFRDATAAWGLAGRSGQWNGVTTGDFNGDGRPDIAVGNRGLNSPYRLQASPAIRVYYGDWNSDGRLALLEAARTGETWYPLADRLHLDRGLPDLQVHFRTHHAFAAATLDTVLGARRERAAYKEANEFASGLYLNRGARFEWVPFPREAQWSAVFSVNAADFDGDGREDLFLSQNFFGDAAGLSRDDAGTGLWLAGLGDGRFRAVDVRTSGIHLTGEQRGAALADFNRDGRVDLAVAQNNEATALFLNQAAKPGLAVTLQGPPGNPDAYGAQMRVVYDGDRLGPLRTIHGGSGYAALDGATQILGLSETPRAVQIRWPGGRLQTVPVEPGSLRVTATDPTDR